MHAPDPFGLPGAPALIPAEMAERTARLVPRCHLVRVPGNHLTMLYGAGAAATVEAILAFLGGAPRAISAGCRPPG